MGCFAVLKSKKKFDQPIPMKIKDLPMKPMMLPEPQTPGGALQSAPPSFRTRTHQSQSIGQLKSTRNRTLSAPSSFSGAERHSFTVTDYRGLEELKGQSRSTNDRGISDPQPLPLPSPETSLLKSNGSVRLSNASGPGPLPLPPSRTLRNFSYDEVASACLNFSTDCCLSDGISATVYRASFVDDASASRRLEATVSCLLDSSQAFKDFVNEIGMLATLQHPQLCKVLGYHGREGSKQRMVLYERLYYESLDQLLFGRSNGPPIDWCTRIKVALGAAQGLAFLHEEGPFQAMYYEFSSANIQIDKDFSAKLSGYGCVSHNPDQKRSAVSSAVANLSVETLEKGMITPKSNVWSFGVVLLELITGRKSFDICRPMEERSLVKWSRPFLSDDHRLSLIIDPRLKGRFPARAARIVADIALSCLQIDPLERPTMRSIVESLKNIQDMKYSCKFPLREPSAITSQQMVRSSSLNGVVQTAPSAVLSYLPSPPSRMQPLASPSSPLLAPPFPSLFSSVVSV